MSIPVLFRDHFQTAYVVRDLDAASRMLRERFGVLNWFVMPVPAGSPIARIGLAWVQNIMIELIEAFPEQPSIYQKWLPASQHGARFHHHGFLIEREDDYRRAVDQFTVAGYAPAMAGSSGDILDFHYADTVADLGHYCELVHLKPAGKGFFDQVPHN